LDQSEIAGWPRNRWELSAAETYTLLYGPQSSKPSQPFKLAVLELVSRRVLDLVEVEKSGFFSSKKVAVLRKGEGTTDNRVLLAVRDLYFASDKSAYQNGITGVEVKSLAEGAGRQYGPRKGFTEAVVMKSLTEQGFYQREQRSFLGIIPYQRWALTYSGEAARARLTVRMRLGESQFRRWVDQQPNRALAYLGLMGPVILLMEPLQPDLRRLREEHERSGDSGGSGGAGDGSAGEGSPQEDTLDFGDLDFGGLDLDFDVLSDLDGAFDAIDSGVDAGGGDGGDGGGDGGNGDNGGD
jgi:hypothetical protein